MPTLDRSKRIKAEEVAGVEFHWDYSKTPDDDLYDALEIIGYAWDGADWRPIETQTSDGGSHD